MLTKSTRKLIHSLALRKGRTDTGLFLAEGPKLVSELWGHFCCRRLFVTRTWASENPVQLDAMFSAPDVECDIISESEMEAATQLTTPQGMLALFDIPDYGNDPTLALAAGLNIALDDVQNPGNLGTIIRLAAWFGVSDVWCSMATADVWSPKAVQASMGGLSRVRVHYINIHSLLSAMPPSFPRYATALDGDPIWQAQLSQQGIIVLGNEGQGIHPEIQALCTTRLLIPSFPPGAATTESLNVGMAAAITLAEFRRRATA